MKLKAIVSNGELVFEGLLFQELASLEGAEVEVEIKKIKKTRSSQQNKSLHLWFTLLAEALNDAGYDMKSLIREGIKIPCTDYYLKKEIFKPTILQMYGKESTSQLTTKEITEVYEFVDKVIAERTGVHVDWPCIENLINNY